MKKVLKYKFVLLLGIVYVIVYFCSKSTWEGIKKIDYTEFINTLLMFPAIFILLGLIDAWIDRETMTKLVGDKSGIKGHVIAYIIGVIGAGPLYVAFPVAAVLLKKGTSIQNMYIFLGAWSTTKIPQLLIEANSMGVLYTFLRLAMNITGILFIAQIMNLSVSEESREKMLSSLEK